MSCMISLSLVHTTNCYKYCQIKRFQTFGKGHTIICNNLDFTYITLIGVEILYTHLQGLQ